MTTIELRRDQANGKRHLSVGNGGDPVEAAIHKIAEAKDWKTWRERVLDLRRLTPLTVLLRAEILELRNTKQFIREHYKPENVFNEPTEVAPAPANPAEPKPRPPEPVDVEPVPLIGKNLRLYEMGYEVDAIRAMPSTERDRILAGNVKPGEPRADDEAIKPNGGGGDHQDAAPAAAVEPEPVNTPTAQPTSSD
jgi:hypothetical protein